MPEHVLQNDRIALSSVISISGCCSLNCGRIYGQITPLPRRMRNAELQLAAAVVVDVVDFAFDLAVACRESWPPLCQLVPA